MTGYHVVKTFKFDRPVGGALTLPAGWKPFAVVSGPYYDIVYARKWCRTEGS
jgi:hypothetical protein